MERRATRSDVRALNRVLIEPFIARHRVAPQERVLDIDAFDIALHGAQEGAQFHAYDDHDCYLPLYVFAGKALLACVVGNSRIDGAQHAAAVSKRLVTWLRQAWPEVRIIVRRDSGFCRQRLIREFRYAAQSWDKERRLITRLARIRHEGRERWRQSQRSPAPGWSQSRSNATVLVKPKPDARERVSAVTAHRMR